MKTKLKMDGPVMDGYENVNEDKSKDKDGDV